VGPGPSIAEIQEAHAALLEARVAEIQKEHAAAIQMLKEVHAEQLSELEKKHAEDLVNHVAEMKA
jgi:outer membrane PBP1 activator LpoA protein